MPPWDRYAPQPTADDAAPAPAGPWAKYAAPVAEDKPQPDTMSDVARSGALGVVEGTGALAGTIPDVKHYQDLGLQWALSKGAEKLGIISPEYGTHLRENMRLDPYRDRTQPDPTDEQLNPLGSSSINHHVMQALAKIGVNTDAPQTTAGEYARTVGSFLPALAAAPESVGVKAALKYAALPGATSETAGQLTKGTDAEPYARLAGAIAPGGVDAAMGTLSRIANPTTRMMGKAVAGTTPQEFDAAQNILNESRAANAPVTVPEALSKATNGGTRLPEIQRVIEGSPDGGPIMKQFYADRPAQVDALGRRTFDQIANAPADPYAVPSKVQEAAQGVLGDADKARSAAVKPLYDAAAKDQVPVDQMQSLIDRINGMIGEDKTGILSPKLTELRNRLTEMKPASVEPRTVPEDPAAPSVSPIDQRIRKPEDLVDFLISKGGVQDQTGDLKAIGADTVHHRQAGRLMNGRGLSPDYAREAAEEAGFLPPNSTVNDLYDAVAEHISGRPTYRSGEVGDAYVRNLYGREADLQQNAEQAARNSIDEIQKSSGTKLSPQEIDHATNLTMSGAHPQDAVEQASRAALEDAAQWNAAKSGAGIAGAPDVLRDMAERQPITDIGNLDRARKYFRDQLDQPSIAQDAIPKEVGSKVGSVLGDLRGMMVDSSPDFAAGKQRYQDITNSTVQPLLDKPIGKLADTNDFTKQSNILFNSKPLPGSHVAVSEAVQQIASKDPEAAGQAVRMYLEQTLNKATKGDSQFGAANFVKAIQDPQQMRNIQAALRALPVGQLRADAFQKAVDIMSAMKERLPFNSATAMNQEIQKGLESGKLTRELLARIPALGSPGKLAEISSNAYAKMASGQNAKNLAQVFTTGNVSDLRALAGSGARSIRGRLLLMGILAKESQAGPQP